MLNYIKAFSTFMLWAVFALIFHYFISTTYFNSCKLQKKEKIEPILDQEKLVVTNFKNDTVFIFPNSLNFTKNLKLLPYQNFNELKDSISNFLKQNYDMKLLIIGAYSENEIQQNSGILRAETVKHELIKNGIDSIKITINKTLTNLKLNKNNEVTNGIQLSFQAIENEKLKLIEQGICHKLLYVEFENNKLIENEAIKSYIKLLKAYNAKKHIEKIEIIGHTDNKGFYQNNLKIGWLRANLVKDYFIENKINTPKLIVLSKGESEPIAEKITEKGRAKNRRIEIKIY